MATENSYQGNILIVDDTLANLDVLSAMLKEFGYKVRPAPSGSLALKAVKAERPELILLDIMMPEMDGFEVCRRLKEDQELADIPVIFISALTETFDKVKAFNAGGVDYVTKPFQAEEVLARVNTHLDLYRTKKELEKARIAAEAANQAKSTFLMNMSHELRSPINIVLGYTDLIYQQSKYLPEEQVENVRIIKRSGEHLLTLIDNVLDLSKIEAGHAKLIPVSFSIQQLLFDLDDMFALSAKQKNLSWQVLNPTELEDFIRTDAVLLRQVLINLISNAIRFTKTGGVILRIFIKKETISFEIEDTGPGISQEDREHIFDLFVQGEAGLEAQIGSGLGLTISKEFVHILGGELGVQSTHGKGSIFEFSIPVEFSDAVENDYEDDDEQIVALEPNQPSFRILIGDDKWVNRQLMIKQLQPLGFNIREARDGEEVIDLWKSWKPDLMWLHLRMPGMSGSEAAQHIKTEAGSESPVIIAVTASMFDEEREGIEKIGWDDFLRRPYRPSDVFAMLEKHLGVRFIHGEEKQNIESDRVAAEILNSVTSLPGELLESISKSLSFLDVEKLQVAIQEVQSYDRDLSETLLLLCDNFEFDKIAEILNLSKD